FSPSDACELTLDPNTAHRNLLLSEDNRRVTLVDKDQPYHFHPDRFDSFKQVLCTNELTGRCYWEVKINESLYVAVTYRGISRRGEGDDCRFEFNDKSWGLLYGDEDRVTHRLLEMSMLINHNCTGVVAVYLDWPAGFVSFYKVGFGRTLTHRRTFYCRFTEPLYPGFGFETVFPHKHSSPPSVVLCPLMSEQSQTEVQSALPGVIQQSSI
ncbi:stonustoxin subunit beta-like, partial [Acanthochromis polyacanthus]|uniref:stonustoxin subunit beta-like n=1 Tax=Acanthochromis polyacanthus TaxID=80966 RepID=UPI00223452A8